MIDYFNGHDGFCLLAPPAGLCPPYAASRQNGTVPSSYAVAIESPFCTPIGGAYLQTVLRT